MLYYGREDTSRMSFTLVSFQHLFHSHSVGMTVVCSARAKIRDADSTFWRSKVESARGRSKYTTCIGMSKPLTYEGCNFFRQRLVLATLSSRPVRINGIRADCDEPGLKGVAIAT